MEQGTTQGPEQQLEAFLASQPIEIPRNLNLDGKAHRFGNGETGREPHWYIGSHDGREISFTVGSHKLADYKATFRSKSPFTAKPLWNKGSSILEKWQSCQTSGSSPYLERKKIHGLLGARINYFGDLVIPMYSSPNQNLIGLQTIKSDGKKLFVTGSKKKGSYFELTGAGSDSQTLYVTEGFATAASICMATGSRVVCAFDCGNLPLVIESISKLNPGLAIIVAGDDDKFGEINAGRAAAKAVAKIAPAIFPIFSSDEGNPTDWNDLHVREGLDVVKSQVKAAENCLLSTEKIKPLMSMKPLARTIATEDSPDAVSGWDLEAAVPPANDNFVLPGLLKEHVGILCSPGGCGKSGVALLIANQIASGGKKDFLGFGPIVGGAACIVTLEDPMDVFSQRQREIKKDFSEFEYQTLDKNIHLINGTKLQNAVDVPSLVDLIQKTLEKKGTDPNTLRLLIIDHLSYWSAKDLNDGRICSDLIKEFRKIAKTLGCAVLILHHANRSAMIKGRDKPAPSSTIGGSYKLHSLARWVAFIDEIAPRDLKKGFKIEGSEGIYKTLIVDKVNHGTKVKLLLRHREERSGLLYKHDFAINPIAPQLNEKKGEHTLEAEIIPKEEIENFNMGEASPNLMAIDENTHHIMNWLSRNPAFETVSPNKRKELTAIVNEAEHDKDRPAASIYKDVWINGDTLIVAGPVCDQEDMKLFALLVNELTQLHRDGARGLILEISLNEILRIIGVESSGQNISKVHRQLDRLRRMSLDFQNIRGHRWRGPLINDVITVGEGRSCKARISFNQFMITFYKIQEYTMFQKSIAQALKGDSLSFYIFYASQNLATMKISVEKCKKLLGIAPAFDKKEALKKIKKSMHDLIAAGVMDPQKTFIKDGNVYTCRSGA